MSEPNLQGGCGCGAIRFELSEPPPIAGYCHCTRCQHRTGGGSSVQARIDARTLTILKGQELLTAWRHPDGGFYKLFCSICGSHMFSRDPSGNSNQMSVRFAAFDGDPGVRPSYRQYVNYAAPWEPIPDDGLERYPESRARPSLR
ncbi:MAG: GFA family protein [Solirubrobacterales bacterium]|nr:GFA family protein [Solirubrobacterales bacterium]